MRLESDQLPPACLYAAERNAPVTSLLYDIDRRRTADGRLSPRTASNFSGDSTSGVPGNVVRPGAVRVAMHHLRTDSGESPPVGRTISSKGSELNTMRSEMSGV